MLRKTFKIVVGFILMLSITITASVSASAVGFTILVGEGEPVLEMLEPNGNSGFLGRAVSQKGTITVQKGETLGEIAKDCGISSQALAAINGIKNPNMLIAGQQLSVPGSADFLNRIFGGQETQSDEEKQNLIKNRNYIQLRGVTAKTLIGLNSQESGQGEVPSTNFDAKFYAENNPDVVAAVGNDEKALYAHFCYYGLWEARPANASFDANVYYSAYPDLQEVFKDMTPDERIYALYRHYIVHGSKEDEERYITTEEKAKEAGITIISVIDNKPVSQPPAAAPSVLYTMDKWWEEYFAYSMSLTYQFIEENHLPNEAKIMLDAKTPVNFDTSDFRQYLSTNYPALLDSFQSLITQTMGLIYRIGDTVEGQNYMSYRISHPLLSLEEYMLAFLPADETGYADYKDSVLNDWEDYGESICADMKYLPCQRLFGIWIEEVFAPTPPTD